MSGLKKLNRAAKAEINYTPPKQKIISYQAAKRQIKHQRGTGPSCPSCTRRLTKHRSPEGNYYTCPKHGFVRNTI